MFCARPLTAIIAASLSLVPALAHATIIASDNFESYTLDAQLESGTDGSPGTGLNGGTGFAGAYNISDGFKSYVRVGSSALSYSNGAISLSGGSNALRLTSTTAVVSDFLVRPLASQSASAVYFSFLYRTNNPTGNEDFIQIGLSNATGEPKASIGTSGKSADNGSAYFFARCPNGSASVWGATDTQMLPNTTYFVVGKLSKGTGNYNRMDLFLNPSTLTEPTALISKGADAGMSSFDRFTLRMARLDSTDVYQIDNLTIGTTFADVIPEPGALTLASVGMSVLALRRRPAR